MLKLGGCASGEEDIKHPLVAAVEYNDEASDKEVQEGEMDDDVDEEVVDEDRVPIHITARLNSLEEQRELFLWKYPDVPRADVSEMLKDFRKYDVGHKNGLDYYELMLLMEYRGCAMTAMEIMGMVGNEYHDSNTRLSFIEWLCAYYMKDYDDMFVYVNDVARQTALNEALKFTEEARRLEQEMARENELREMRASIRAAALERESKLTGVMGMKAFFTRKAEDACFDVTKSNEEQIRAEASRRRALRTAREKIDIALRNAHNAKLDLDTIVREVQAAVRVAAEEDARAEREREQQERLQRSARKQALSERWQDIASPVRALTMLSSPKRGVASCVAAASATQTTCHSPVRSLDFPALE